MITKKHLLFMLIGTVSAVLIALVILFLISAYMRLSHIWTASCHAHHLEAAFFHYFDIAQFPEGDLPVEQYLAKMSDTEREIAKQLTIRIHRKGAFVTFTMLISLPGADSSRWYKTGSASRASLSRAS